jgi:hypothetical protein
MLAFSSRVTCFAPTLTLRYRSSIVKPSNFLTARNGDRVPYPVGIEKPIAFPILSVGAEALKDFLSDDVPGAALINKAQEIYAHVHRPHMMLWARGSWIACSSNSEVFMARTQQEVCELAYRYFQPADGSVDCYVGCVGSEFAVVICMDKMETHARMDRASDT